MNRLRFSRVVVACIVLAAAVLLFLDFTGSTHLAWLAKIQLVPALLATNVVIVLCLLALTLLFGRLYCSVICPLGLLQDVASRLGGALNKKRRFSFSPAKRILRYSFLGLFVAAFVAGVGSLVALLDPFSSFGRIISQLLSPLYKLANNLLAHFAERADSYAFYSVEVIVHNWGVVVVGAATLLLILILAMRNGRTYCNTVCPVGTTLGFFSQFSLLKIVIDTQKCTSCRQCERSCKASAIDIKGTHTIDYSRCVVCFDCLEKCRQGAISYAPRRKATRPTTSTIDSSKRSMLTVGATLAATTALNAKGKLVDGGVAIIEDKVATSRHSHIVPAGGVGHKHFAERCVGCQLCVTLCPNNVLRPSSSLLSFMQPEASFEVGYCRPECTKCSEVCPTGAILPIDRDTKASTRIGCAVLIRENCVIVTDKVECNSCATHCPSGAIQMVEATDTEKYGTRKIPTVTESRCIGCGACENLCPARPFSAIYVEGFKHHITL